MSVKLQGVTAALARLHHELDAQAEKLTSRIETTHQRGATVFAQAHKRIDGATKDLDDVDKLISDLERSNGGPTLDDSQESSGASGSDGEPSKSWAGK